MTWNESIVYEQRVRFVVEVQQGTFSFSEPCRSFDISFDSQRLSWFDLGGDFLGPPGIPGGVGFATGAARD